MYNVLLPFTVIKTDRGLDFLVQPATMHSEAIVVKKNFIMLYLVVCRIKGRVLNIVDL